MKPSVKNLIATAAIAGLFTGTSLSLQGCATPNKGQCACSGKTLGKNACPAKNSCPANAKNGCPAKDSNSCPAKTKQN